MAMFQFQVDQLRGFTLKRQVNCREEGELHLFHLSPSASQLLINAKKRNEFKKRQKERLT